MLREEANNLTSISQDMIKQIQDIQYKRYSVYGTSVSVPPACIWGKGGAFIESHHASDCHIISGVIPVIPLRNASSSYNVALIPIPTSSLCTTCNDDRMEKASLPSDYVSALTYFVSLCPQIIRSRRPAPGKALHHMNIADGQVSSRQRQ